MRLLACTRNTRVERRAWSIKRSPQARRCSLTPLTLADPFLRADFFSRNVWSISPDAALTPRYGRNRMDNGTVERCIGSDKRSIGCIDYSKKNWFGVTSEVTVIGWIGDRSKSWNRETRNRWDLRSNETVIYIYYTVWIRWTLDRRGVTGVNKGGKNAWSKYDNCILDNKWNFRWNC